MAQVPSKQYPLFIKAFETYVSEKQQEVESARRHEKAYIAIKEVLDKVQLPNDMEFKLRESGVALNIFASNQDYFSTFENLASEINAAFISYRLRDTMEVPKPSTLQYMRPGADWTWHLRNKEGKTSYITYHVFTPRDGLVDYQVDVELRQYTSENYHLNPRTTHRITRYVEQS